MDVRIHKSISRSLQTFLLCTILFVVFGTELVMAQTWWDTNYTKRRPLTVTTGSLTPDKGYQDYTVRFATYDTASLVTAGELQSDCEDLRLIYWNGAINTEIPRHLIDCNSTTTDIRFAIQTAQAASSSDAGYYLYYNNATAGAPPPVTPTNVYLWYDDVSVNRFSSYTTGRGDNWHGSAGQNTFVYNANGYYTYNTGDNRTNSFRIGVDERDVYVEAEFYHTACYPLNMTTGVIARGIIASGTGDGESSNHYYATSRGHNSACGGGYGTDGDIVKTSRTTVAVNGTNPTTIVTNTWRRQGLAAWSVNATNLSYYDNNNSTAWGALGFPDASSLHVTGSDASDHEGRGFAGIITAQDGSRVRNVLIRRYVVPEPVLTIGDVEMLSTSDYSDAPSSYGSAEHTIDANLYIGTGVTADNAVVTDDSDTDDITAADFQDYAATGGMMCSGVGLSGAAYTYITAENEYCVVVPVTNNTGNTAQLVGWLDFNDDNSFDDPAERSSIDPQGTNASMVDDNNITTGNVSGTNCTSSCNIVVVFTGLGDANMQSANSTYIRLRLTTDSTFFSSTSPSPIGSVSDGEVEDIELDFGTLPVTLSHFSSARSNNKVNIDWGTSSELFNVGFQLWGLDGADGQWHKLHNWLVRSGSGNAVEPQSYRKRVRIPRAIEQLVSIGISSVDSDGTEHYYGPFELGVSYGELGDLAPIAWDQVRAELDARMAAQGYTKSGVNGYRKASSPSALGLSGSGGESVIEFSVSSPGVYRISGSELPEVWHSSPKGELALLDYQGHAVVRHVQAKGEGRGRSKALGAAGSIYFYSGRVTETERLYSEAKVYRLVLDSARALTAAIQRKQGLTDGLSESYREVSVVEEDEYYVFHSEVDDPWLDEVVIGYSDKARVGVQPVPVESDLVVEDSARLLLGLGRSSALGAVDLDGDGIQDAEHIVTGLVVSAEGEVIKLDPVSALGSGGWDLALPVPAGTLLGDANGIVHSGAFFNAGEGYAFSEVHIDSIGLEYSRPTVSKVGENHLFFSGTDTGELGYSVRVPDLGDKPWVFASDGSNLVRIVLESQRKVSDSEGVKWREVTFSKLLGRELSELPIHYWVSGRNGFYGVEGLVEKVVPGQDSVLAQAQGSDYVIVSHPMFMGPDEGGIDHLSGYADFKRSQGYTVSMINYLDIVESFGGGQVGPWGLTHYLSELKRQSPILKYLLLVGSSVYDHSDKLGTGALTFIPGHYVPGSHSNFTVSDVPYITDGDGDLVAHIGRWPVRELSELQVIMAKSMQWGTQDHSSGEVLLIAEHTVGGEEIDFAQALDGVAQVLPNTYSQTKVYVDAIMDNDPGLTLTQALALAKGEIIDELNNTPEVVVYNGHASTGQLSNQNLFKHSDVSQVTTPGAEIWVPLSCYVTYYESTTVNTLAHQLLFTGNAVTITGAMLLSNQAENIQMGEAILDRTLNQGQSIGEAVTQAKAAQSNPSLTNNWAILGDPSSVLTTQ